MPVTITYLGHSGFLVSDGTHTVAIDPFLTGSPVATIRASTVKCNAIIITHGHEDHVGDAVAIAKANKATIYSTWEIHQWASAQGAMTEPMNIGGSLPLPRGAGWVALTQAFHSSSHGGTYMGMPMGAMLNLGGVTIYHTGDTGIFSDMKLLSDIYKPEIACIPIGDRFTMGIDLATMACEQFIRPKVAIPIHYNTFDLIKVDVSKFAPKGVTVKALKPGEAYRYAS